MMYSPQTEVHVTSADEYILLKANRPILVARVLQSLDFSSCRSAAMQFLPTFNQWSHSYRFHLPENTRVSIVSDGRNTDFLLNDAPLKDYTNISVETALFTVDSQNFSSQLLALREGTYSMSSSSNHPFVILGPSFFLGRTFLKDSTESCDHRSKLLPVYTISKSTEGQKQQPVVFRIETLGDHGSSRKDHINLHQMDRTDRHHSESSGPSIVAVVLSISMAVLLVIVCIGGFVVMDMWNRRQVIGRVKVSPHSP